VGEQGALEGDDGPAGAQRVGDLRGENGTGNRGRGLHAAIMEVDERRAPREAP
jgi:hypothetical protein